MRKLLEENKIKYNQLEIIYVSGKDSNACDLHLCSQR